MLDDALHAVEVVVLLVDHDAVKVLNMEGLAGKLVYDTRGMLK